MSNPAWADITGKPFIVNGDTFEIAGQIVRIYGIDAPEDGQMCGTAEDPWRCGQEAGFALAFFITSNWVTCLERGRALSGEVTAACFAGGVGGPDIGRWLVANGWALALPQAGDDYAAEQEAARKARLGLLRAPFTPPWEWRRQQGR